MKNILFLEINSSYSHSMLSYAMLRAYTEKHSNQYNWHKLEYTIKSANFENFKSDLKEFEKIDIICGTTYLFNVEKLLELTAKIHEVYPEIRVILGGPEFLGDNSEFLENNPQIEAVLSGDEAMFFNYLESGKIEDVKVENLDDLPTPYTSKLINKDKPFIQLETARGCINRCTFCTSSLTKSMDYYSLDRVWENLKNIYDLGFREVRILDRSFNYDEARAVEILQVFRKEYGDVNFHLEFEPIHLGEELLYELKLHKNLHIEIGLQSFNVEVLKKCKRFSNTEKIINGLTNILACRNLEIHCDLIAGLPLQTSLSIIEDVQLLINLNVLEIQLEVLKMLPGTPIRNEAATFNPKTPYNVISTPTLNELDLKNIMILSKIIDSYYNDKYFCNVFKFCCYFDNTFLLKFWKHILNDKSFFATGKNSIEIRYRTLLNFVSNNKSCFDVVKFCGLFNGFDCAEKIEKITQDKRVINYEFSCNVQDIFENPKADLIIEKQILTFHLYYGRKVNKVTTQ